jgi:hypothetical protein
MTNYVPFATENLEEIKTEVNTFILNFLGIRTDSELIETVLENNIRIMMYKGVPLYAMPEFCPNLNSVIEQLKAKYGEIIDQTIWVGVSNSLTPIMSSTDRKFNFVIPCRTPANFKLQFYNYTGTTSISTSSNDGINFASVNMPNEPNLLVHNETITAPGPGWMRVDDFHSVSNWSSDIFVYITFMFENQNLIESELFS